MALKATIVNAWQDEHSAYIAMAVDEGDKDVNDRTMHTEYIAQVPLTELEELSEAERTEYLLSAVKAKREAQIAPKETIKVPNTITLD